MDALPLSNFEPIIQFELSPLILVCLTQGTGKISISGSSVYMSDMDGQGDRDPQFVVALIENRAREVGLAALDLRIATLHLSQFIETSRSYQNTVTLLQFFNPTVILLSAKSAAPEGMVGLANLVDHCSNARKVPLVRGCFDDTKGTMMLQNLAAEEANGVSSENYHKQYYLCLGAAAAALYWTEHQNGYIITKNSLQVIFNGSRDHMNIDATSIMNLEVISPLNPDLKQTNTKCGSLYGMLNTTKTVGGARLLRANLLQPLKALGTINARLDCLDDLTNNEQLFFGLVDVLQKFPKDTDRVLGNFCFKRRKVADATGVETTRRSQALVAGIILLKEALELLPLLSEVLQHSKSCLLHDIKDSLDSHPGYGLLSQRIAEVISQDALHGRSAFAARTQQCFAVKQGVDGYLDVARRTFNTTSEAIHALGNKYRDELELPKLRLLYSSRHGFYIGFPEQDLQERALPAVFVQVVKRGKNFNCSTCELTSLNSRNQEAAAECYVRTEQCLEDLTNYIRENIRLLSLLSESVSLLDMMVNSFANMISTKIPNSYVRPEFTESGPLVIEAGRHPVLEGLRSEEFVPNNTFLGQVTNLMLVTGPNMCGKSTYLRQVALITILAHVGCYIPARFASFRIVDHLFTRIGTGDNLELNSSTFMTEMRETAFLLQYVSCRLPLHYNSGTWKWLLFSRSLIVIDELGRATSTYDGFAIAWSCSEFLLSLQAYVVFATHMHRLAEELPSLYPDAKSCYFSVAITRNRLDFKYVLRDGFTDIPHYGLLLSEISGIPADVISKARDITKEYLQKKESTRQLSSKAGEFALRKEYHVAQRLLSLQHSHQTPENLRIYLTNLKDSYSAGRLQNRT